MVPLEQRGPIILSHGSKRETCQQAIYLLGFIHFSIICIRHVTSRRSVYTRVGANRRWEEHKPEIFLEDHTRTGRPTSGSRIPSRLSGIRLGTYAFFIFCLIPRENERSYLSMEQRLLNYIQYAIDYLRNLVFTIMFFLCILEAPLRWQTFFAPL